MDWQALRRIVTGDDAGPSHVVIDGGAAKLFNVGETGLAEIWEAALGRRILDGEDRLAGEEVRLEPTKGAVKLRWFTVAPEDPSVPRQALEETAAQAFAAIGAAHARVGAARHPFMHKTQTLDFIVLVKGEIELLLDDGPPLTMKPGDVVVQRATSHAWINRGSETALLVAVLIDASAA